MKDMIYIQDANFELLHKDNYKDFDYYIISYGTHPCCYVDATCSEKDYQQCFNVKCHGGITYCGYNKFDFVKPNRYLIGWDYSHFGDQHGTLLEGKRWTTEELVEECKAVIDQLAQEHL